MLLKLSLLHIWREKNYPEFRVMSLALFLAVFSITTLLTLSMQFQRSMNKDGASLLGADLIVESPTVLPGIYQRHAENIEIKTAEVVEFFSMISANDTAQLAIINAIKGNNFPLRGKITIKKNNQLLTTNAPPPPGHVWAEEGLAIKLSLMPGDKLSIGDATLTFDGTLITRPMALSDSNALAPVAYVNEKDLASMAVLQEGSRATFRLLLASTVENIAAYKAHFGNLSHEVTWVSASEGRPAINRLLRYSQRYLAIIILIQVLLAGTAIALCSHQYYVRSQRNIALWKTLGATNDTIIFVQCLSLGLLALIILMFAVVTGLGAAILLLKLTKLDHIIHTFDGRAIIYSMATGLLLLAGFALAPILALKNISPLQLIQQRKPNKPTSILGGVFALGCVGLMFIFYVPEPDIALRFSLQMTAYSLIAFAIGYLFWQSFALMAKSGPTVWRFGVAYMVRHKTTSILQWFVFTIVIMTLLLIQIIQRDFIQAWKDQLPINTPNYFLLNIQEKQLDSLQAWFKQKDLPQVTFYPIVRASMSSVNGKSIEEINQKSEHKRGLSRSINMTWMQTLPKDNQVVSGIAWDKIPHDEAVISIEERFAQRQGLTLGDTVGFQIADQEVTGKIVQIRTVQWESFKPNFFVIFSPGVLNSYPHSFITSIYLPHHQKQALLELTKTFVEISVLDIDELLIQARKVLDNIATGLQVLLLLVFILGILIMYASILSCLKERITESALLQILGARKKSIAQILVIEFGILGLLSVLAGSVLAILIAHDIANRFFDLTLNISMVWLLWTMVAGIITLILFGIFGTRKVFQTSSLWLLRENN